jgi:hypothetical protein
MHKPIRFLSQAIRKVPKVLESFINTAVTLDLPHEAAHAGSRLRGVLPYAAAILVGAFLLFQVQLIIGKYILPWFGGAPAVWTTCMLVFQVLLLAGYIYAYLLATRMSLPAQVKTHLSLMGFSLMVLAGLAFLWPSPITPGANWKPEDVAQPVWHIVRLLTVGVGVPFFLLATTSPLLQGWFARTQGRSPYRLFALSNVGSLLGLLSYPFLLEPNLTLRWQAWMWFIGYVAYAVIAGACAVMARRGERKTAGEPEPASPQPASGEIRPGLGIHLLWLSLAACACAMFLATTNMLCQEIAVIPFLWVLPLSLYLLTFIACFESSRWYHRGLLHPLYAISLVLVFLTLKAGVLPQVGSYLLALFVVGMICHGELVRLKPTSKYLTAFYLMVAGGGAAGGVFVALIAPFIFPHFYEFQIAIWDCGLLLVVVLFRDRSSWFYRGFSWLPFFLVLGVALIIETCNFLIPAMASYLPPRIYRAGFWGAAGLLAAWLLFRSDKSLRRFRWTQAYALGILVLMGVACVMQMRYQVEGSFARFRSFFGAFRIEKKETNLILMHGRTRHGWQIRDGTHDPTPTSYYATNTGIGILLWDHPKRLLRGPDSDLRIGVVGLGVGTLAAYGRPVDYYAFYEIDPAIARIAQGPQASFTFLKNSAAKVEVVLGDGRLSLEREAARGEFRKFDVLVLDAFNSDSIPVHLMTREAMQLYLRHLRGQDSVVAFHISNKILDLTPVLQGLSKEFHLALVLVNSKDGPVTSSSRWGLLSRNPEALRFPKLERRAEPPLAGAPSVLWTDDYSNLFRIVKKHAWW